MGFAGDRVCRFHIYDKSERGWLLDGEIAGIGAAKDLIDITRAAPKQIRRTRAVGHQTAVDHILPKLEHPRNPVFQQKIDNLRHVQLMQRIVRREHGIRPLR